MSLHSSLPPRTRLLAVRRQVLSFSGMALLGFVVIVAVFKHTPSPTRAMVAEAPIGRVHGGSTVVGWRDAPGLAVMGLATGILGGMLGMGAGVLNVSGLLLVYDMDISFARAVSVVTMFVVSVSAAPEYLKDGWGQRRVIYPMILGALPGTLAGAFVGNRVSGSTLMHAFGLLVLFLSLYALSTGIAAPPERLQSEDQSVDGHRRASSTAASLGALHGLLCGLFGISGGVIVTPVQQNALHAPWRHSVANTLVVSTMVTALGSVLVVSREVSDNRFALGDVLLATLFIGSGALVGFRLGSRFGQVLNVAIPRLLFEALGTWAGLSIWF
jgi:uncharacterized protein